MIKRLLTFTAALVAAFALIMAVSPVARVRAQSIAGQYLTNGQVLIGSTGANPVAATITGTSNQVAVTNGAGTITVGFPAATPILIGTFTSAQLATLTAPASGYLAVNITTAQLCISTGPTGAWVVMSTSPATAVGVLGSCHS